MFLVLEPVSGVLTSQLAPVESPVGSLSVLLVHGPHAFILITVLIVLNTESLLAVISPITDVPGAGSPHLALNGAILLLWLLLDPVHGSVRPILLCLGISDLPVVDERSLWLEID